MFCRTRRFFAQRPTATWRRRAVPEERGLQAAETSACNKTAGTTQRAFCRPPFCGVNAALLARPCVAAPADHPLHRSTSPSTMSTLPRMITTSETLCPRHMSSSTVRLIKLGGRTRYRYGFGEPSLMR